MSRTRETEIARICTGTRNILNTEWPIETVLTRVQEERRTRPYWLITYNICNGIAGGSKRFYAKAEALAELKYLEES